MKHVAGAPLLRAADIVLHARRLALAPIAANRIRHDGPDACSVPQPIPVASRPVRSVSTWAVETAAEKRAPDTTHDAGAHAKRTRCQARSRCRSFRRGVPWSASVSHLRALRDRPPAPKDQNEIELKHCPRPRYQPPPPMGPIALGWWHAPRGLFHKQNGGWSVAHFRRPPLGRPPKRPLP
jgi:hypothetical protein